MNTSVAQRKMWKVNPRAETLSLPPSLHPVIGQLLWQRGIRTDQEAERFFSPDFGRDTHDPFLFRHMDRAVDRIFQALRNDERITIHGDYDADGVTGSAVLTVTLREILRAMGKSIETLDFYVPHREREGYGVHEATVRLLAEAGTRLMITVDCGIACAEAVAEAKRLGIDTIVTDHHEFPSQLPEAILIHPKLPGETYPFPHLAAVGVAWKLACALFDQGRKLGFDVSPAAEKWLLDLVAIATVTDVVPLVGENRALEFFGLKVLRKTKRLGLQKLYAVAGIRAETIDTWKVGFQIGPRINAAGRMEHAEAAFRLLVTDDEQEAEALAAKLQEQNSNRQQESNRMFEEARRQIIERQDAALLWACGETWSAGLVGLVAGKLAQEFGKPVLVMGRVGDRWVGSGRSIPGFHITEALGEAADCLDRFGGHPQACGFSTFTDERFSRFLRKMDEVAARQLAALTLAPLLTVDVELAWGEATLALAEEIERMRPFGEANPEPKFLTRQLTVVGLDAVGEGKHLRLLLKSREGVAQKGIAFGWGLRQEKPALGNIIDLVYELGVHRWNGFSEAQCKLVDFRDTET
ncbi:single-stranded-DNA-specific exonuclease RecJ [Candidatus Uhrbacteria bacterium]|nr:single-stranded-DNA-specific exonuclease RecJ [Candidatus Uhrbacteria bacterium]